MPGEVVILKVDRSRADKNVWKKNNNNKNNKSEKET
jgi:hypothetical protein